MKEPHLKKELFIAVLFLLVLLSFNFTLKQITKTRYLVGSREAFEEASIDVEHFIENRITRYDSLLYFGRKLFESSDSVSRTEFSDFFSEILTIEKTRYTAVDTIAFVEKVSDKKAYVDRVRQEKTKMGLQFLYFNLENVNDKKEGYIMNYLVPHESSSRYFGFDLAESEELLSTLKKSGEDDSMRLSESVDIFGEKKLLLVEPIYRSKTNELKSKKNSLLGYMVLVLNPGKMFDNVFDFQEIQKSINIRVYPESKTAVDLLYIDINDIEVTKIPKEERLTFTQSIPFNGKNLRLITEASRTANLSTFEQIFPDILFFGGSILVISFFFTMMHFKMKSEDDQKE